jgi:hypothetical protein
MRTVRFRNRDDPSSQMQSALVTLDEALHKTKAMDDESRLGNALYQPKLLSP